MTEDQKQTIIEMLEGIVRLTSEDDMPEWAVKAAQQKALAALRTVKSSMPAE